MKLVDIKQFMALLGYDEYDYRIGFSYRGKQNSDGSYVVDEDSIEGFFLDEECDIDESGVRAKPLDNHLFSTLGKNEKKARMDFERDVKLVCPCTPIDVVRWAELNGCAHLLVLDKGRRETQIELIIKTANDLGIDLLNVEEGGRKAIKTECLKLESFSDSGFDHAWRETNKTGITRMVNIEKYMPKK